MEVKVNLDDVEKFVKSQKFTQFLIENNTRLETVLFIVQTLLDKLDELGQKEEEI